MPAPSAFYEAVLRYPHQKLAENSLAKQYLRGTGFSLDGEYATGLTVDLPFGRLDQTELAHLFGIYDGSRVHVQREEPPLAPEGMYFTVVNGRVLQCKNKIGLVEIEGEGPGLHLPYQLFIDQFFLSGEAPPLLGTLSFALCAITAHLCGLRFIELVAAGGAGFHRKQIGYRVWPKLGFDAALSPDDPAHLPGCVSVLDVTEIDPQRWDDYGSQRLMRFDLSPDSRSWAKLLCYLQDKGLLENDRAGSQD